MRQADRASDALVKSRGGRFVLDSLRAARSVVHGFRGEKISLRASALTYITMLSLVPLLAVLFAIVHGMGQEGMRRAVHEFVFNNLAPGVREQIGSYLDEFIARASTSAMGGLGGVFLLASAVGLFHNIERSLDEIWGVARPRTLLRRVVIYWCVLTLGPVVLGGSVAATSLAHAAVAATLPKSVLALVPWAASAFALFFLYFAVPNAKVRVRAALGGALVAATAWEIAKHLYTFFATHSFRYSAIYGSLGAIPLFLLWVYVSWLVVLFGARLAYALQYAIRSANAPRVEDARWREVLCARIALEAVAAFRDGAIPPTPGTLSRSLSFDGSLVAEAIDALREAGLMAEAIDGGIVPSRSPEQISLVDVARAARGTLFNHSTEAPSQERTIRALSELFAESDRLGTAALAQDLAMLAQRLLGEPPKQISETRGNSAR